MRIGYREGTGDSPAPSGGDILAIRGSDMGSALGVNADQKSYNPLAVAVIMQLMIDPITPRYRENRYESLKYLYSVKEVSCYEI